MGIEGVGLLSTNRKRTHCILPRCKRNGFTTHILWCVRNSGDGGRDVCAADEEVSGNCEEVHEGGGVV
jgi:hypothetical protein